MKPKEDKTTTIVIKKTTYTQLKELKIIPEEAFDSVVRRIFTENQKLKEGILPPTKPEIKKIVITTQIKDEMERDLTEYVMNPEVKDTPNNHRAVWEQAHPGEVLTTEDPIHHINGLHFDNRPENLQKTTPQEHAKITAEVHKEKVGKAIEIIEKVVTNGHI